MTSLGLAFSCVCLFDKSYQIIHVIICVRAIIADGARYVYRTVKDIRFPLSVRNERAAMQRLLALVKESIDGYPTSLEEDRAALKVCVCVRAVVRSLLCKDTCSSLSVVHDVTRGTDPRGYYTSVKKKKQ